MSTPVKDAVVSTTIRPAKPANRPRPIERWRPSGCWRQSEKPMYIAVAINQKYANRPRMPIFIQYQSGKKWVYCRAPLKSREIARLATHGTPIPSPNTGRFSTSWSTLRRSSMR